MKEKYYEDYRNFLSHYNLEKLYEMEKQWKNYEKMFAADMSRVLVPLSDEIKSREERA